MGREPDRVLKMDRGNARPESGGRRRLPGDVLRLSLVDRAPGEKHLCAVGNSGNVIYVVPNRKIVTAVSSYFKPTVFDRVDFIEDVLLPALQ